MPSPAYIRRMVNKAEPTPAETKFCRELSAAAIATGLDDNTGLFALDSAFRRLAISHATFFGAARALLLQIAHPVVAQGVHDHSDYAGLAALDADVKAAEAETEALETQWLELSELAG